ncbi:hypothetical protein IW262DRAFT_1354084 [Armillaria fumosa]|nr:hypothetical protein IW262DRAFT_1354084 [Armillaria fumosa]
MTQAPPSFNTRYQLAPPVSHYFTFSIDVEATLDLYCDGGDEVMKQKLEGIQNQQYAATPYHVINMRPVQQGLTKPHSRKPQHTRPTMCVPILPTTAHPRNREPSGVEDSRYGKLLRAGLDDDRILQILDGQEDGPDTDDSSETDSKICKTLLAKIPGMDKPEEDYGFVLVIRIDHVLSNVPEVCDLSQLHGDVDLFLSIVEEYQLARYGFILLYPPEEPEFDVMSIPENFSMTYSLASSGSSSSLPEALDSDPPDSHALDLSSVGESGESEQIPVSAPGRKVKSLFRRVITDIVQFVKRHKFSTKL